MHLESEGPFLPFTSVGLQAASHVRRPEVAPDHSTCNVLNGSTDSPGLTQFANGDISIGYTSN